MASWREQYDRMKRWRKRVQSEGDDSDNVRDNFYAFAQACHHLVDWLENDKSQPIRRSEAKAHVAKSAILTVCRDICNGSKHAQLNAKKFRVKDRAIRLGHEAQVWALSVEYQDQSFTASWFARLCIAQWNDLLRARGLLRSKPRRSSAATESMRGS